MTEQEKEKLYTDSVNAAGGRTFPNADSGYFITERGTLFMVIGRKIYRLRSDAWRRELDQIAVRALFELWIRHDDIIDFLDIPTEVSRRYRLNQYPVIDTSGESEDSIIVIDYFDRFRSAVRSFLDRVQTEREKAEKDQKYLATWDRWNFRMYDALDELDAAVKAYIAVEQDKVVGLITVIKSPQDAEDGDSERGPVRRSEVHYLAYQKAASDSFGDELGKALLEKVKSYYRFRNGDIVIHTPDPDPELKLTMMESGFYPMDGDSYGRIH